MGQQTLLTVISNDLVHEPSSSLLCRILVSVDFLLLKCPLGKLLRVCPHRDPSWHVYQPKVARFALPCVALPAFDEVQIEEGVIVAGMIVHGVSGELLVGGHEWRRNIVREEECLRVHVQELNDIIVENDARTADFGKRLSRDDLPFVV